MISEFTDKLESINDELKKKAEQAHVPMVLDGVKDNTQDVEDLQQLTR